jgi:hypothetical protein
MEVTSSEMKTTANGCYFVVWSYAYATFCNCTPYPGLTNTGTLAWTLPPACHPFELSNCNVSEEVIVEETKRLQKKHCFQECNRNAYEVSITYAKLDYELYNRVWIEQNGNTADFKPLDENTILLNVYHPIMEFVKLQEIETYTFITLISNIGGAAGLWLGASLMSFIQVIFYFTKWASLRMKKQG